MSEPATPAAPKKAVAAPKKSGPQPRTDWQEPFLAALRRVAVVGFACAEAGVDRATAYRHRDRDEAFLLAWHDALEEGLDALEQTAHLRARAGQPVLKTVTKTHADGTVETTVTEERHVSDSLLMFILKRHRPEFRESFRVEQTGAGGGPIKVEVKGVAEEFYAELDRLAAAPD